MVNIMHFLQLYIYPHLNILGNCETLGKNRAIYTKF